MDMHSIYLWWETIVRATFQAYSEASKPILDVVHIFFQSTFNIILLITCLVSVIFLIMTIYTSLRKNKAEEAID